ncbi:MAG: hypothetical protein H5U40_14785 [Polyangiaceae bacterium]|nr:hypothetical protein [Polyangiaceae bacterium]
MLASALAAAALLAHCPAAERCSPGASRCSGNVAEVCSANGFYHELANCDLVSRQSGVPFVCGHVEETTIDGHVAGHTCVPAVDEGGVTDGAAR